MEYSLNPIKYHGLRRHVLYPCIIDITWLKVSNAIT